MRRLALSLIVLLAVTVAAWILWPRYPVPPFPQHPVTADDPRLTWPTPYRNVNPEVRYTGSEACADCHAEITRAYRQHPMGRSLSPIGVDSRERFDTASRNPFEVGGFRYAIERRKGRIIHRETFRGDTGRAVTEMEAEVQFVVGSGQRGRSYLVNREGALFQSPITWYPQRGIWDLSPGYDRVNAHFGRPVIAACLFCHANAVEPVPDTAHRYEPPLFRGHAIGCERCHGPGTLHVMERAAGGVVEGADTSIVNPRRLDHALREAVCQQCHLQGQERILRRGRQPFDFRPGMPLPLFLTDFVKPPEQNDERKFVGTVEQMTASRCYRESRGDKKMGCISCHDPHEVPAPQQKIAFYRARCLQCHGEQSCSLPPTERTRQSAADSCIACHMPATGSEVSHTSISDHRIPRRPEKTTPDKTVWPRPGEVPLVAFHATLPGSDGPEEARRDLGIALMELADRQPDAAARELSVRALPHLEEAVRRHADDMAAAHARADALWQHGRLAEAMAAYEGVLTQAPRREVTLARATTLAGRLKQHDAALRYGKRLVEVNPWRWEHQHELAGIYAQRGDWTNAAATAERAAQLNPTAPAVQALLVNANLQRGDKVRARQAFDVLIELMPREKRESLRKWFEQRVAK